jgi:hypothetical protein
MMTSRRPNKILDSSPRPLLLKKSTTPKGKGNHASRHFARRTLPFLIVFFAALFVFYQNLSEIFLSPLETSSSVDILSNSNAGHALHGNVDSSSSSLNVDAKMHDSLQEGRQKKAAIPTADGTRIIHREGEGILLLEEKSKKYHEIIHTTSNTEMKSISCLTWNSKDWLEKPRYGNIPGNYSHTEFPLMANLLDHLPELLDHQNVCHEQSLFRNMGKENAASHKNEHDEHLMMRIWRIRLMYMSFYYHQHEHAMREAKERRQLEAAHGSQRCKEAMQRYNVQSFDYECKNAKFLLAEVRNTGIGSILKRDLFNIFMAGVVLNRTVILYNAVQRGVEGDPDYFWSYPWQLASCPRQDYQCTFRPITGCVPLMEDIYNATNVHHRDIQKFMDSEQIPYVSGRDDPPPEENTRIIRYIKPDKNALKVGPRFLARMNEIANAMIDQLAHDKQDDDRIPILRKAAESILLDEDTNNFYKFGHEHSGAMIAFMMYFLRPRIDKARMLEEFMQKDLPQGFDSSRTLGLPFRGSDKCNQESQCLSFPTLMRLLRNRWFEEGFHDRFGHLKNVTANILVTSELPNIMELAYNFSANDTYLEKLPFYPVWITNTNDVHQGNGSTKRPVLTHGATADDITLSILSSFKLQLNAASSVGNCCSNFHQTLFHLLRGGCGLHIENKGQCLQDRNESIYQLCCDVRHKRFCPGKRLERLRKEYNDKEMSVQDVEAKLWEF